MPPTKRPIQPPGYFKHDMRHSEKRGYSLKVFFSNGNTYHVCGKGSEEEAVIALGEEVKKKLMNEVQGVN